MLIVLHLRKLTNNDLPGLHHLIGIFKTRINDSLNPNNPAQMNHRGIVVKHPTVVTTQQIHQRLNQQI